MLGMRIHAQLKDAETRVENQSHERRSNAVNAKAMLTGKTTRLITGAIFVLFGFVLMYHENFGIHIDPTELMGNVPLDMLGGVLFAIGVFLGASGMRED
jgi:hypothetical protein